MKRIFFIVLLAIAAVVVLNYSTDIPQLSNLNKKVQTAYIDRIKVPDKATMPSITIPNKKTCSEIEVLQDAKNCTFLVETTQSHGSGFAINSSGYIVTNFHVIEGLQSADIKVKQFGRTYYPRVVDYRVLDDIAVLKIEAEDIGFCSWQASSDVPIAAALYAFGWPNDPYGDSTVTKGIFSRYVQFENTPPMIQTDTPINPGNSGGPLIDECGVVGINTSKLTWVAEDAPSEGIGYAIQSDYAKGVVDSIISTDDGNDMPIEGFVEAAYEASLEENSSEGNSSFRSSTNNYGYIPQSDEKVAYDYDEVLFWEEQKNTVADVLDSWNDSVENEFYNAGKLSELLANLDRMYILADELWDGYTNSKISYAQARFYKKEFWELNNESATLSNELTYEAKINSHKACIQAWEDLEKEYDQDFDKEKEECEQYLE